MIIVLDTNVLVAGLLNPFGKPAAIVALLTEGKLQLAFDARIMTEYQQVLNYPKFHFSDEVTHPLIEQFKHVGISARGLSLSKTLPDPDDDMFLEVAHASKAQTLVTGNKKLFPHQVCDPIRVFSPDEFLNFYRTRE